MSHKTDGDKFAILRQQAEDSIQGRPPNLAGLSPGDIQRLIYDLQVHQIELQLQNEELQRTQVELWEARNRYADLYNFAPVGYFTLDAQGAIVEANLTCAILLSVDRSSLIGAPLSRFVAPEDRDRYAVFRVRLWQSEEPQRAEINLVKKDGVPFRAWLEGVAAYDQEGRFVQARLTVSDMTERVRAEEAALKAFRLEVVSTLAGGIAHDINNLMTMVLGNAELLKLDLNHPNALDMLTTISDAARRASELAQQMLAFARGGKYQPRLMNLNDTVQEVLRLQQHSIPLSIVVEQHLASDLWTVAADASQMSQVIVNLLTNAVEASNGNGRISVSTANLVLDETWTQLHLVESIHELKPGRYVGLSVEDKGSGMSAEVLAKVFEPFFTTKFQGRGMGLAALYGIVQNHGGDILIESEPGHGTVVRVYLPAFQNETQRP